MSSSILSFQAARFRHPFDLLGPAGCSPVHTAPLMVLSVPLSAVGILQIESGEFNLADSLVDSCRF